MHLALRYSPNLNTSRVLAVSEASRRPTLYQPTSTSPSSFFLDLVRRRKTILRSLLSTGRGQILLWNHLGNLSPTSLSKSGTLSEMLWVLLTDHKARATISASFVRPSQLLSAETSSASLSVSLYDLRKRYVLGPRRRHRWSWTHFVYKVLFPISSLLFRHLINLFTERRSEYHYHLTFWVIHSRQAKRLSVSAYPPSPAHLVRPFAPSTRRRCRPRC